jgi:hypothetical protein
MKNRSFRNTRKGICSGSVYSFTLLFKNMFRSLPRFSFVLIFALSALSLGAMADKADNIALNRPVIADSVADSEALGENAPELAVDGIDFDDASRWLSQEGHPSWIEVDLGGSYRIDRIRFKTGNWSGAFPIEDCDLQYWSGSAWEDLYTIRGNRLQEVDRTFEPIRAGSRVRLYITKTFTDDFVRLYELEIYGQPDVLDPVDKSPVADGVLMDPTGDLTFTFGEAVAARHLREIGIEDIELGRWLSGVAASVSGRTLRISHTGLSAEKYYRVRIPDGAVVLASDSETGNKALEYVFSVAAVQPQVKSDTTELPDLIRLLEGDFEGGYDGFVTANRLFGLDDIDFWRLSDGTTLGPGGDLDFLRSVHDRNTGEIVDFVVSPAVELMAEKPYELRLEASAPKDIELGWIRSRDLQSAGGVEEVIAAAVHAFTIEDSPRNQSVRTVLHPPEDGLWHLIFYSRTRNAWSTLELDAVALDQVVTPFREVAVSIDEEACGKGDPVAAKNANLSPTGTEGGGEFRAGKHPRLFFDPSDVEELRNRRASEPYRSIYEKIIASLTDPATVSKNPVNEAMRLAVAHGFLYVVTGDEQHARASRTSVEFIIENTERPWASTYVFGLSSYAMGTRVALAYDWCASSEAWNPEFNERVSKALAEMGEMILEDGGIHQNTSPASNWQAGRGGSGGLCLLATDHDYDPALLDGAYKRVVDYLDSNFGSNRTTRGWNPEGLGYTYYPLGNFLGPFGDAMRSFDADRDIRKHIGLQRAYWSIFEAASTAVNVYGFGGVKPDWSDDNAHIRGEGTYGQAFFYLPDALKASAKWAYDRLQGARAPHGPVWDYFDNGAIWSYLYYPKELRPVDPATNLEWRMGADDSGGLGLYTFRNGYAYDGGDFIAQFKARLKEVRSHDGPDGLGFRIIGHGVPWVVGGGRNNPGRDMGQATLYPAFPVAGLPINLDIGSVLGSPLIKPNGGGHVIGSMKTSNVGVSNHKRWFAASYDRAETGADAAFLIADTSNNGTHWMLPTYFKNTLSVSGNTFTITGENGATMHGTVLHPANARITMGTMKRGSAYTLLNGGTLDTEDPVTNPRIDENKYICIEGEGGQFLVALTVQAPGLAHPTVSQNGGFVSDAVLSIGSLEFSLHPQNILWQVAE